ncbi:MAG: CBS domain-containing protein [Candidatus Bathyarchaeia archaeon]
MASSILTSADDIRRLRRTAGLTQKELAKRAGVSQSLIARIERGTVDPRLSTLQKIVKAIISVEKRKVALDIMNSPVITVDASDSVRRAVELMKRHGISQMPVLRDGRVVGGIKESTLVERIAYSREPEKAFAGPVRNVMEEAFATVSPSTSVEDILALLLRGQPAVLVMDRGKLVGIVTKIDVIASTVRLGKV